MAEENRQSWKRVVVTAVVISVGVGFFFGVLGAYFNLEVPGAIIGAIGGVIFGALIASRKTASR